MKAPWEIAYCPCGSCMPSSACQNPSLTYMALTARACDYVVKELKKKYIDSGLLV